MRKKVTIRGLPFILFFLTAGSASAQLVEYDIRNLTWDGNPVAASAVGANISATSITVTGPAGYDNDFWGGSSENMWLVDWSSGLNISENYYEFTISADSGFELNLTEITVGVASESGSNVHGPQTYRLYSDIDGFNQGDFIAEVQSVTGGSNIEQRVLSTSLGVGYEEISSVTFRVYGFENVDNSSFPAGGGLANFSGTVNHDGSEFTVGGTSSNVLISGTAFDPGELTITDAAVSNLGETEATFSSSVPSDGGNTVTGRGFVYAKFADNPTPEIGGTGVTQVTSGSDTGSFSETVTGLDPVTEYAVRSYASTSTETIYSDVTTFGTLGPELVRYDIDALNPYDGNPLPASFVEPNVTAQDLTFDNTDLSVDNDYWGDAPESIFLIGWQNTLDVSKNYFEFTVEAEENYTLNLSNLTAGIGRESGSDIRGPKIFRLYSDIDGFTSEDYIAELQLPDHTGTESLEQRVISTTLGSAYNDVESVTFRIYAYDDISTGTEGEIPGGGLANFSGDFEIDGMNNSVGGTGSDVIISGVVLGPPTVTTTAATEVAANSATFAGNVTDDGGFTVTEHGVVWDTSSGPDINDNKVEIGDGLGEFDATAGLLPFGTEIFHRAYAVNSEGTAYGDERSFTTDNTVTHNLDGSEGWRLLSVPAAVSLENFLDPIWTQGVTSGGDTDAGDPNVFTWNINATDNDHTEWWDPADNLTATTLQAGQGIMVLVYEDPDYDGPETPGFPQTLSVTGSEHSAPVSSPPLNSNTDGWTLMGNPFSVPVFWDDLGKTDLNDAIYIWDTNVNDHDGGTPGNQDSGSWITRTAGTGDFDGVIAPFQGFFVQADGAGSPAVSFTQDDKTTSSSTFYGKEKQAEDFLVRLELTGEGMSNSAWLRFSSAGRAESLGRGDAWELQPLSSDYVLLGSQKKDGSLLDIGHYPSSDEELSIPLVVEATRNGSFSLQITDLQNNHAMDLYLNDLGKNESIRLKEGLTYEFTLGGAAGKSPVNPVETVQRDLRKKVENTDHRFVISTTNLVENHEEKPAEFALKQNYPNPFNPSTVISYQLPVNSEVRLELFDLNGRQIATLVDGQKEAGLHSVNFDGSNLSSGVYMYRLQVINSASDSGTGSHTFTKKLTLIK